MVSIISHLIMSRTLIYGIWLKLAQKSYLNAVDNKLVILLHFSQNSLSERNDTVRDESDVAFGPEKVCTGPVGYSDTAYSNNRV